MKIDTLNTISQIASREWLIMQSAIPKLACAINGVPSAKDLAEIDVDDFYELREPMTINESGVATIHVHNTLIDSAPAIYEKLGIVTKYDTLKSDIDAALEAGAKAILFLMDSPGGTVAGNVEIAEYVMDLDVPTATYAQGLCCSAAYKIAASTDQIVASPSASVGNIGTILSWVNMEDFWRSMGVKFEALTSDGADLKSTFHTEPNETQRAFLQSEINESGAQFKDHVIAGRTASGAILDDEIWRAGWYSGEKAGALGLVDAIGSIDIAYEYLSNLIDN